MANDQSARIDVLRALALLQPCDGAGLQKRRLGVPYDGGYVLVDDFASVGAAYSFGIGSEVSFDRNLAELGIPVRMFDHTVEGPPNLHPLFGFRKVGLGATDDAGASLFTLEHHLRHHNDTGRTDLLLKIDVEGAEFDALVAAGPDLLRSFRQIVLEIHWLHRLADPAYRATFCAAMQCVRRGFQLVHVHANNCCPVVVIDGLPVADVLELTFFRSDLMEERPSSTIYPTTLDYANDQARPDHLLWFFPFLPAQGGSMTDAVRPSLLAVLQSEQEQRAHTNGVHIAAHENALATLRQQAADLERQRAALIADLTLVST